MPTSINCQELHPPNIKVPSLLQGSLGPPLYSLEINLSRSDLARRKVNARCVGTKEPIIGSRDRTCHYLFIIFLKVSCCFEKGVIIRIGLPSHFCPLCPYRSSCLVFALAFLNAFLRQFVKYPRLQSLNLKLSASIFFFLLNTFYLENIFIHKTTMFT